MQPERQCHSARQGYGDRSRSSAGTAEPLERRLLLTASIVRDINLITEDSHPTNFVPVGNLSYFAADDGVTGHELWRTDGTDAGTTRVADIYAGPASSRPNNFAVANGKVFFTTAGTDVSHPNPNGGGVWVSDGSAAGTLKLSDAIPYGSLVPAGQLVYFRAKDPEAGYELWVTDGTAAGTRRLKDINPGPADSMPLDFHAAVGNILYFNAKDNLHGQELWRTDGTDAGTYLVKDINPGAPDAFDSNSSMLAAPGGAVFFVATTAANGTELWKTDGTAAGTTLVSDINFGPSSSRPEKLSMVGGSLYFAVSNCCNGKILYRTDGTDPGTVVIRAFLAGPDQIPVDISRVYELNGAGYFWTQARLWRTNGTTAGTFPITQPNVENPEIVPNNIVRAGNSLYFISSSRYYGLHALWRTDGTTNGTVRLTPQTFQTTGLAPFGNAIILGEGELKTVAATDSAPRLLKDINAQTPYGSDPQFFHSAGPYVYFLTRFSPGPTRTYRVWRTDGTEPGTVEIFDTGHDPFNTELSHWKAAAIGSSIVFAIGSTVFVAGPEPASQRVLMDGVQADYYVSHMYAVGDKVYFATQSQGKGKLWITDGQTVQPLADVPLGYFSLSAGSDLAAVGDGVYFAGIDAESNAELWRTDGTPAGTSPVKDLLPGPQGSFPRRMVNVNGTLFFMAQSAGVYRWWKSDGTPEGTVQLPLEVLPYSGYDSPADPKFSAAVGGVLYFAGVLPGSTSGIQLWKTDGTAEGTHRVGGITGGPTELTVFGDRLLYVADKIPYVTDGTPAGTIALSTNLTAATFPDGRYTYTGPVGLTRVGNIVYFVASDGVRGMELYRTDGTVEGTAIVADIGPGWQHGLLVPTTFVRPPTLAALGDGAVIFAGTDSRGSELWRADNAGALIGDAGAAYTVVEGRTTALSAAGSRAGTSPIVSYEWDFDFDGTFVADASGVTATFAGFDGPATKTVALRVTDAGGNSHVDTVRVTVTNAAPEASIDGAATANEGASYTLRLSWHDDGNDTVRHWTIAWGDGTIETVQGNPSSVSHVYADGAARQQISASVTDEDGTFEMRGLHVGLHEKSFGSDGTAVRPVAASEAVALQSDGKIITVGGSIDFVVARWNADGSPDLSFGEGGGGVVTTDLAGGSEAAHAVIVQPDDRIVVAGWSTGLSAVDWLIARYMPDGTLDPSFGTGGKVNLDVGAGPATELRDIVLQQDGRIVLAGSVDNGAGDVNFAVGRLDTNGQLDVGFGTGGITVTNFGGQDRAYAVALQPNGRIVLAGDGNARFALARYTADGAPDNTFGTGGKSNPFIDVYQPQARDVAIASDGGIVIAGTAYNRLTVLRYRPDGALDQSFGRQGMIETTSYEGATSVAIGSDGRIVASGGGGQGGAVLARVNPNGVRDETFGGQGMGFVDVYPTIGDAAGRDVLIQPDGHVLVVAPMRDGGTMLARFIGEEPAIGVEVRDVPPTILLPEQVVVGAWTDWALPSSFSDPGADSWTATVRYGSAAPVEALPLTQKAFTLRQNWPEPGEHLIMVMVTDEDGITSSKTLKVIVRGPTLNGTAGDDVFRVSLDATGKIVQFFENVPDGAAPPTFTIPAERVAALSVNGSGGSDRLIIDGGAYPFATDLGLATPGLKVTVERGSILFKSDQHLGGLSLSAAGRAAVDGATGHIISVGSLSIADGASLDVGAGEVVLPAGAADVANLRALLARGRGDGSWSGRGITSSVAAAASPSGLSGLATAQEGDSIRIKYAFNGDANLDGRINADDYFQIDSGFLEQPQDPLYARGDFSYDGKINADDYFLIDSAFLGQAAQRPSSNSAATATSAEMSVATPQVVSVASARAPAVRLARRFSEVVVTDDSISTSTSRKRRRSQ